eukprot:3262214-Alexandrium_andersonii.AAC.1
MCCAPHSLCTASHVATLIGHVPPSSLQRAYKLTFGQHRARPGARQELCAVAAGGAGLGGAGRPEDGDAGGRTFWS